MIGRLFPRSERRAPDRSPVDEYFQCTGCRANFDEWAEDCPRCGQLVVRVVDRPG